MFSSTAIIENNLWESTTGFLHFVDNSMQSGADEPDSETQPHLQMKSNQVTG